MSLSRLLPGFVIGLVLTGLLITLRIADPITLATMRGAGFDTMQRLWPRQNSNTQVRIVDIDEASLKKLGQWPWPRTELAKLVNELYNLGSAAIAFDIIFPEPDRMSPDKILNDPTVRQALGSAAINPLTILPNNDSIFAQAISGHHVVLAFAGGTNAIGAPPSPKAGFAQIGLSALNAVPKIGLVNQNIPALEDAAAGLGNINIDLRREQGITRQIPMLLSDGKTFYPSLALESLRVAQGGDTYVVNASPDTENVINSVRVGDLEIPLSENGQLSIYYANNMSELYISAARVIDKTDREVLRPLIEGHIVLIGTSAVSLQDTKTSSLGDAIPGVSIHAQALQQILSGTFLKRSELNDYVEMLFVGLIGIFISLGTASIRPIPLLTSLGAIVISLIAGASYAFRSLGYLIDITFPIMAVATIYLATIAFKLLVTDRQGRQLRTTFSHYVAPSILTEIESNPKALKLGGETRDVTVMFVDIQNFTPLGENLEPEVLVGIVNNLLSACSAGVLAYGGTIDKFIGDAVMAFWNAPIAQKDHQYLASLAALEVLKKIEAFNTDVANQAILKPYKLWPISVRIGLASGPAIVGNMGSLERFDYSVLGQTVNIASRAEGLCKQIGHNIVIAGELLGKTKTLAVINAGAVVMRGKTMKTPIHALFGDEIVCETPEYRSFSSQYDTIYNEIRLGGESSVTKNLIKNAKAQSPLQASFLEKLEGRKNDYQ